MMYEQNIRLEQEYYGSIQLGAFPTRGWELLIIRMDPVSVVRSMGSQWFRIWFVIERNSLHRPLIYFLGGILF